MPHFTGAFAPGSLTENDRINAWFGVGGLSPPLWGPGGYLINPVW